MLDTSFRHSFHIFHQNLGWERKNYYVRMRASIYKKNVSFLSFIFFKQTDFNKFGQSPHF